MARQAARKGPQVTDQTGTTRERGADARLPLVLVAVLVAVVVAVLALGTTAFLRGRDLDRTQRTRDEVIAAARQVAINLNSQDYRTIDADLVRQAGGLTGTLAEDVRAHQGKLRDAVVKNRLVTSARVFDAGLVQLDGRQASVLVVVDQTITNARAASTIRRYRFGFDLSEVAGRWLAGNLTAYGLDQ